MGRHFLAFGCLLWLFMIPSSNYWKQYVLTSIDLLSRQQDYIQESDNLVSLHDQINDCDSILSQMETLLGGFQVSYISFFFLNTLAPN